jgi:general secretion pathway protein K
MPAGMNTRAFPQQGLALVLVLWMMTLLTVIASSFVFSTRTEATLALSLVAQSRAEALADAGVNKALHELIARPFTDANRWSGDGRPHFWQFEDGNITIIVRDESALIDINSGARPLLLALFLHVGLSSDAAEALVDAVQDWRDSDSHKHPRGAEATDYLAAGLLHKPANAPFSGIDELRLVLGMNEEIYRRIAGLITVYSGQSGINPAIAPREVLLALPGADPAQVDAFVAGREAALATPGQGFPEFPPAQPFFSLNSKVLNLRVEARLPDGTSFVREAVVKLAPDPRRPVVYLAWNAPGKSLSASTVLLSREQNAP